MYTVVQYGRNSIMLSTKHDSFSVPVSDFSSFAGGLNNFSVTKDEMDQFLALVRPDEYQAQVALEDKILSLAARADRIKAEVGSLPIAEVINTLQQEVNEDVSYDEEDEYTSYLQEMEREEANRSPKEWNSMLEKKREEIDKLNKKLNTIATNLYSQKLDFANIQIDERGIKFIIQFNNETKEHRFCWDPFGFSSNFHSAISEIYRSHQFYTINGGWIRIIGDDVILYAKSGDYGVYDDKIAMECAKKVFPGKKIHSFADTNWEMLQDKFKSDYPF